MKKGKRKNLLIVFTLMAALIAVTNPAGAVSFVYIALSLPR